MRSNKVVEIMGATTLEIPANVCAIPIVVPNSNFDDARDIRAVVAGNTSAAPIGTRGTMTASDQRFGASGYAARPTMRLTEPARIDHVSPIRSTIGPIRAERMRTEKIPTYRKTYPIVFSVIPNSALRYSASTDDKSEKASIPTA